MRERYENIVKYYPAHEFKTIFRFEIKTNEDYGKIFTIAKVSADGEVYIPETIPSCYFDLSLDYEQENADELLLHNYILLFIKAPTLTFRLNITAPSNSEYYRIATYLSGCSERLKKSVTINRNPIDYTARFYGKILPAIPIDTQSLSFLRKPLDRDSLNYVLKPYAPDETKQRIHGIKYEDSKRPLLDTCRRCLMWNKFEDNESTSYQVVRETAFLSTSFKERIKNLPFLALLLFAQYDYYYRSSIVREFKKRSRVKQLNMADIIENFQPFQQYNRFSVYKMMCKEQMDIKSLLYYPLSEEEKRDSSVANWKTLPQNDDIKLHESLISDLFEARTLAEGLLQLIENAVLYAHGGLLSLRIREYECEAQDFNENTKDDHDTAYLVTKYRNYFGGMKGKEGHERTAYPDNAGKQFYLEVKLSDFAEVNMKRKFIENTKKRKEEAPEELKQSIQEWLIKYENIFETLKHSDDNGKDDNEIDSIFQLFFDPTDWQLPLWRDYYKISENRVHHFGLQIFASVLRSKAGGLCVSGHQDNYFINPFSDTNQAILDCKELDCTAPGTSYRFLLPLNHRSITNNNVIVDTSFDRLLSWKEMKCYRQIDSQVVFQIIINAIDWNSVISADREKTVGTLSSEIQDIISRSQPGGTAQKYEIVFDYEKILKDASEKHVPVSEEELTKSLLLYLLRRQDFSRYETPPVAIVGLSPNSLLEVTRIIALFYDKWGEATDSMKEIQIFLKGTEIGEEILFAGSNINQTADRITRLALTRGNSADYISIAQSLLSRRSAPTYSEVSK